MNRFVFTCGDINGIGPEICLKTFNNIPAKSNQQIVFVCPENVFEYAFQLVYPNISYKICSNFNDIQKSQSFINVLILKKRFSSAPNLLSNLLSGEKSFSLYISGAITNNSSIDSR